MIFAILLRAVLLSTFAIIYAAGNCVDLNVQAAKLQGESTDFCLLMNSVISNGDILGADIDVVDVTCGVHLEVENEEHPNCVEEVVKVVADIIDEGCEVTAG